MGKYVAALLVVFIAPLTGCSSAGETRGFTLDDVQGYWWESCDDPAVQFAIQGDRYFGDFEGESKARVENDTLVIDQRPSPSAYRIMAASAQRLVLRPVAGPVQDWVVRSCPGASGNGP
jgi:hypothetical protein